MSRKMLHAVTALFATLHVISAVAMCPDDPNCLCGGTFATEIDCNINGKIIRINMLPNTYLSIKCENARDLDYDELPKFDNPKTNFKSVSFKDCPLPMSSFKEVLSKLGVAKTMTLIFQNAENLTGYFDRKHFFGLKDLTKLLLSVQRVTELPDNLFLDLKKLTWLNIRSNIINLPENLFKPLERLETLEISHSHMTNITSNLFSHLSYLKKLSLWQSNVTWFSKDFFSGVDVLEELDLSSNGLNELPASIFKPLRKLKKLTLFSNKFATLPRNLFKSNDELQTVIILNNDVKLKSLPKYLFSGLKNLKQAYIQRSGIENVPYDLFANSPNITNISLAHNDIEVLPELVFNDQINLLELDLSYNKLSKLEPKLFSSLIRLESLNLCHNNLVTMDGSTFSSLLSLMYLNMENNNIKTISSYIFDNNKQKMTISLAYNELGLKQNGLNWTTGGSPFLRTFNLKLLNLSHNEFTRTFDDWWINGHEMLDISFNSIKELWAGDNANQTYQTQLIYNRHKNLMWKSMQQVWISHNPLRCSCGTYQFINFLQIQAKAKVVDLRSLDCSHFPKLYCYLQTDAALLHIVVLSIGGIISTVVFFLYGQYAKKLLKDRVNLYYCKKSYNMGYDIDIKYTDEDEEFVLKEFWPILKELKHLHISIKHIDKKESKCFNFFNDDEPAKTVVIFSPNYLTSVYSKVNIKKIRGQMLKAKNTLYLFTDIGPENSIYTFLKNQRDHEYTILWSEPDFWSKFLSMLPKVNEVRFKEEQHVTFGDCPKYTIYPEYPLYEDKPPEYPTLFKDGVNFSQV